MIKEIQKYFIQFVLLVATQLLIFNNIEFSGFVNPYVYILFILLLPFNIQKSLLLIMAFAEGLMIDVFSGTPGVHTTATVLVAFLRPAVAGVFAPREGYISGTNPRVLYYGFEWFVKYATTLIIIHHFVLFYLEVMTFDHFFATFFRSLASSAFTLLIVVLSQFLFFRK
jgi:hypothetical protein